MQELYDHLPVPAQHIICSMVGASLKLRRFDTRFGRVLSDYEIRAFQPIQLARGFRDRRLAEFLGTIRAHPFYRSTLGGGSLHRSTVDNLACVSSLPVLTKRDVSDSLEFTSPRNARRSSVAVHTSGTTGGGFRFFTTRQAEREQWAVWWRYRRWHGIDRQTWCGYFGGRSIVPVAVRRPPFWRLNWPMRQLLFSQYHLSYDTAPLYLDEIRKRRLPWLHGYPSTLALLAAYSIEHGFDVGESIRWVTTGAENLFPHQVDLIRRAFGVAPRQHYGMAEAVANFSECERGKLHVDEDFAYVEFVPTETLGLFRIVGTNFTNPATPLVRYDTGDLAWLSEDGCGCGRPGRVVARVDGRSEDYVVLRNGVCIGRLDHIFKDLVNVREAQIYQEQVGEVVLRVVRGPEYSSADEESLRAEARSRLSNDTAILIDYVDSIRRTATGKLRFVVSTVRPHSNLAVRP